jgi:hypothetical protein
MVNETHYTIKQNVHEPSGLEPAIKHLLNTFQSSFPSFRRDSDVVNFFPMNVGDVLDTRQLFELLYGTYTDNLKTNTQSMN